MAFETINLGTHPAGTGGDTARSSFEKVNRNFLAAEVLSAAMSQAQFEAIRAQNKERYAASGWVSFGNHESGKQVNECKPGLYTSLTTPNTLLIGKAGGVGGSKTDHGVLCMAGVIFHLPLAYPIRLAQAPDGKTTYNKSTGVITNHATVAAAFNAQAADPVNVEVVINREDMWGFEAFPQEVTQANPEIYPQGVFSDLFTSMNGIPTSDSARPVSYFGFLGKKAKKVDFFALSDAQKKKVLADPKNNLYYSDDGRLIQWVLRGFEFAGASNVGWESIDSAKLSASPANYLQYSNGKYIVKPQGVRNAGLGNAFNYPLYGGVATADAVPNAEIAIYAAHGAGETPDFSAGLNGECYFLVCGTVNRLNQWAYHPSFNPSGSSSVVVANGQAGKWYSHNYLMSKIDCFNFGASNEIGKVFPAAIEYTSYWSGRPDGRCYDAIYADGQGGVCRDMRYSACGVDAVDSVEADQKVKNGTYRGFEKLNKFSKLAYTVFGYFYGVGTTEFVMYTPTSGLYGFNYGDVLWIKSPLNKWYAGVVTTVAAGYYVKVTGYIDPAASGEISGTQFSTEVWANSESTTSVGGSFLQTDVIGNPENILATPAFADGWQGSWAPNTESVWAMKRKSINPSASQVYTANNGVAWGQAALTIDAASSSTPAGASNLVWIGQYQAFATQTEIAPNAAIYGLVPYNVFASSDYRPENGALLGESLIGKVLKNNSGVTVNNKSLLSCAIDGTGKLTSATNFDGVTHPALTLGAPANNSSAFKAVSYLANINQQAVPHYAYTELKHNGTNWGDDGKVTIVDNQSTKTDLNGNTVLVGTAKLKEPIGWIKRG